jgi:hypothetical protein
MNDGERLGEECLIRRRTEMTDKGRREGREGGVSGIKMHPPGNRETREGGPREGREGGGRRMAVVSCRYEDKKKKGCLVVEEGRGLVFGGKKSPSR